MPGALDPGYVTARGAFLDALEALRDQIDAIVVIGAQAAYLRTDGIETGLAALTLDADLAIDRRALSDAPLLEHALLEAGMTAGEDPGTWHTASGVAVDIMLPRALANPGGQRGARMPPHGRRVARRTVWIEACVVDCDPMDIRALDPTDVRESEVRVAGPAGLIIAKNHEDRGAPRHAISPGRQGRARRLAPAPGIVERGPRASDADGARRPAVQRDHRARARDPVRDRVGCSCGDPADGGTRREPRRR